MIRTRFAPSPTGYVHVGSLRTALFSYLFARHSGGVNILRIEDTDQNRLVAGALENLVEVLHKMGIEFDEGYYWDASTKSVLEKGDFGPYLQSKRLSIYKQHAQDLLAQGSAYYCYCSEDRLEELRKEQAALKKPSMYDRACRNLSVEERQRLLKECQSQGREPVIRQAVPLEGATSYDDLIYNKITIQNTVLDDQVLVKADGFATYNFANVVDDHLMQISHVIRGEEFLSSTPKHVLLYRAFNWQVPFFAHLPLILNPDKSKLSKRQGDVAVESYLQKGYLKEALVNFVAFLGWNPKSEQEIFSLNDLIREFDLSKVNKSGAVFDIQKLDWINGKYVREMDNAKLANLLIPYWEKEGWLKNLSASSFQLLALNAKGISLDYLIAITAVEKERLKKLSDILETTAFYFSRPKYNESLLTWRKSTLEDARIKIAQLKSFFEQLSGQDFSRDNIEVKIMEFIKVHDYDNGSVLWPLRVALTGLEKSSGPFDIINILATGLGKEEILSRLQI